MLIAARNGFAVSGWKNPYITDGLVTMWDGKWNVGGGVHDSATTLWVDIIGGKVATLSSGASFGGDACLLPLTNAIYSGTLFNQSWSGVTVEFVYRGRVTQWQTYPATLCSSDDSYSFFFHTGGEYWAVKWATSSNRVMSAPGYELLNGSHHMAFTLKNTSLAEGTLTIDGVSWSGGTYGLYTATGTWQIGGNNGRFLGSDGAMFAVRIYSRALTTAEIAANYAVDKARFNLP